VWLCVAALTFVVLALLLIPPVFEAAPPSSAVAGQVAFDVASAPAYSAQHIEPVTPPPPPELAPTPPVAGVLSADEVPPDVLAPGKMPDFSANIADRGDRPLRSAAH